MNTSDVLYALQHDLRNLANDWRFIDFCFRTERRAGRPLSIYRLAEAYRRSKPDDTLALRGVLARYYAPSVRPYFPFIDYTTGLSLRLIDERAQEMMGVDFA